MKMKVKPLGINAMLELIAILNEKDAKKLGVHPLERIVIKTKENEVAVVVNVTKVNKLVKPGEIGVYEEVKDLLKLKRGQRVEVERRGELLSKRFIKEKIYGYELDYKKIFHIVKDVVDRKLNTIALTSLVVAYQIYGMSIKEAVSFAKAMAETGNKLKLSSKVVADKHSCGGVPGDKTTMVFVPLISSLGIKIPKTSSRAITDPAGTADRVEALMKVDLSIEEMKKVVEETNGCMIWGGAVDIAPADDLIINIERPMSLDSFSTPSIMAKKYAVGATHLVVDIPTGPEAKVKSVKEAKKLFKKFKAIGKELGIKVWGVATNAYQPLGHTVGPNLEAREVLETLMKRDTSKDFVKKAVKIGSWMLKLLGYERNVRKGERILEEVIKIGQAERQLRRIIKAQRGKPGVKPEDVRISKFYVDVPAKKDGFVYAFHNSLVAELGRIAGAPFDKEAGVYVFKKLGEYATKGSTILRVYTKKSKAKDVKKFVERYEIFEISNKKPKIKPIVLKFFK